jgi:hypothetical protein
VFFLFFSLVAKDDDKWGGLSLSSTIQGKKTEDKDEGRLSLCFTLVS